ncbi:MAG: ABC transporter substrate-binding protein [Faecalibacterium sp.]
MKHFRFCFCAAVLTAAFALSLTGCGSGSNSFTWFVDTIPANLDPQVASEASDVIACENLYSGLVRRSPDGELVPELCERWEVSPDGRTYTFTIRQGLTYRAAKGAATSYAITAEDFVFAFQRVFDPVTNSPYAVEFSAIENSVAVLSGQMAASALGVCAANEHTLVIRLSQRDDTFLSKLTLPGAMPCDQAFFESTRGTYGLTKASTLSSGSFYLYNWTASGLFLRRESSGTLVDSLRLVQDTSGSVQTAEQRILNERCTADVDESGAQTTLRSVSFSDTTWCLMFNCSSVFSNTGLRQALAGAAREAAEVPNMGLYTPATGLIPEGLNVDGIDYRAAAGNYVSPERDIPSLYRSARQGMVNSDFNKVTLLLPAGCGLEQLAGQINGVWQKQFALFFSIEQAEQEEFDKRLANGNYTIALAPISAESGSVYSMLHQFTSAGGGLSGWSDLIYSARLEESTRTTGTNRCQLLAACERQLLDECVVVPLFAQQERLLIADGVDGLVFDPFGPVLDLTYTTKS